MLPDDLSMTDCSDDCCHLAVWSPWCQLTLLWRDRYASMHEKVVRGPGSPRCDHVA